MSNEKSFIFMAQHNFYLMLSDWVDHESIINNDNDDWNRSQSPPPPRQPKPFEKNSKKSIQMSIKLNEKLE